MGKIKELLIDAAEYRMAEIHCEYDEAHDWATEQTFEYLQEYVNEHNAVEKPERSLDEIINYYENKNDLNDYETAALNFLTDYKDLIWD